MGWKKVFKRPTKVVLSPIRVISSVFKINPWVALAVFAIGWLLTRKPEENPDFGDTQFDNFEKGILLNKQSNDASIPVIYGERLVGGTRVFVETSGTDNQYLYIALVLCEGEIEDITEESCKKLGVPGVS